MQQSGILYPAGRAPDRPALQAEVYGTPIPIDGRRVGRPEGSVARIGMVGSQRLPKNTSFGGLPH